MLLLVRAYGATRHPYPYPAEKTWRGEARDGDRRRFFYLFFLQASFLSGLLLIFLFQILCIYILDSLRRHYHYYLFMYIYVFLGPRLLGLSNTPSSPFFLTQQQLPFPRRTEEVALMMIKWDTRSGLVHIYAISDTDRVNRGGARRQLAREKSF